MEWDALEIQIEPKLFSTEEFQQRFDDWLSYVETFKSDPKRPKVKPSEMTITELMGALTAKQLWGLLAWAIGILASVATAAFKIGEWMKSP